MGKVRDEERVERVRDRVECRCSICHPIDPAEHAANIAALDAQGLPFKHAWEVAAAIKTRGGYFELTPDRAGFYVRRVAPTPDELAWIRLNRDRMLACVQGLLPPESFLKLQRNGEFNIGGNRRGNRRVVEEGSPDSDRGRPPARQEHLGFDAGVSAEADAPVHRSPTPASDVDERDT